MGNLLFIALSLIAATNDTINVRNIDEVTVIASPKENSPIKEQPISASIISQNDIKDHQITSIKGVSSMAPNFFMPDYGSRLTSAIYIRGIGSRINNPAVGLYIDNIPYNDKSAFDFNITDIERIEVLRGPQGTLYGRNTMGGLIRAYTHSPFTHEGTDVHLGYATRDNHRTIDFTHFHHSSDNFAWYVGGYYEGSDGFFKNEYTGKKVDDMQAGGGRVRALWTPTSRLKFDLNVNYDYSDEGAYPYFIGEKLTESAFDTNFEGKIANNHDGSYRRSLLNVGLNTQYEADRFTLSNVTGYQALNDRMFLDQDFVEQDIYTLEQKQKLGTLSDELTFKSKGNKTWNWVSGAYFMYQHLKTDGPVTFLSDGTSWLSSTINGNLPTISVMGQSMPMSVTLDDSEIVMGGTFKTPVINAAIFHQSTLELTDKLEMVLGLRVDYEHTSMKYNAPAALCYDFTMTSRMMPLSLTDRYIYIQYGGEMEKDYLQLMPKIALKYKFNDLNSVYATVARGTRSGGYNVQMFSDLLQTGIKNAMMQDIQSGCSAAIDEIAAANPRMPASVVSMIKENLSQMPIGEDPDIAETTTYKPEYSWNYEVGTHLSTSDRRWQADGALFFIDTRDQQIARFAENGLGRRMVNAGHSQSRGAEISISGAITRNLNVMLSCGDTYAKFKKYDAGDGNDYSHNYVPFVPRHTVNFDANYSWFFNDSFVNKFTLGATYTGAGKIYWTEDNSASQKYYQLLSARATIQTKYVQVSVWGHNITDTSYNTFYFESMGRGFNQKGKPAQVGIDLRWHF